MGFCTVQLSERCELGWGQENNQCFQCKSQYMQYFGTCIETCPKGMEEYMVFPRLCVSAKDVSTADQPDMLYVLEDPTKAYHEGNLYFHLMDALAAAWAKYTVIYLLGEKATYRVSYMYSHMDNADYLRYKEFLDLMANSTWMSLKVQSLPFSVESLEGCYQGTTTLPIYPTAIKLPQGKL